jgi:hypothetical protein
LPDRARVVLAVEVGLREKAGLLDRASNLVQLLALLVQDESKAIVIGSPFSRHMATNPFQASMGGHAGNSSTSCATVALALSRRRFYVLPLFLFPFFPVTETFQ